MIGIIMQSRVKYVVLGLVCLFFVILFLTTGDTSEEEEALIKLRKRIPVKQVQKSRQHVEQHNAGPEVQNFDVKFYSGKEVANILDGEKKPYQVHKVKINNLAEAEVKLECEDPFSKFGKVIAPGGYYKFAVTDLFAKRHYWCKATFGSSSYKFKAYGEGAPRDNNIISLFKEAAFINGKSLNVD